MQLLKGRVPIKIWVNDISEVESQALTQLRNTASLPWVEEIAVMPDVHFGYGATVGSVIKARKALSPSTVGVDIGCGMCAVLTPFTMSDFTHYSRDTGNLRNEIEKVIPLGLRSNERATKRTGIFFKNLGEPSPMATDKILDKARVQLGTLGGGNHFIEICTDEQNRIWVMLHSGSRGPGKELAELHVGKAKGLMGDLVKIYGDLMIDEDLAALVEGTEPYNHYIQDLLWSQRFAKANRDEMMLRTLSELSKVMYGHEKAPEALTLQRVDCHHNYVEFLPDGAILTRKGAVSAKLGELGIIPGSMGARSYIVRGLGNEAALCSCSHGAGRKMSRGAAKQAFSLEDLAAQTEGVNCRKDRGVLDEAPGAYKDIDQVMANQIDLVEPVATLKQFICIKG